MRQVRIVLVVAVLAAGFSILGLAAPGCAYACSCMPPRPIAEYANEPDTLILSGTVTAGGGDQLGTFRVERWYRGSSVAADLPIRGGDGANCGIPLTVGQELVMVAYAADGVLSPSICSPYGDLSTPEGRQLQADAIAAFGDGTPPGDSGGPTGGSAGDGGIPGIIVLGVGALIAVVALVAGASFISGRRAA